MEPESAHRFDEIDARLERLELRPRNRTPQEAWARACSLILALPGLRGFWPMSATNSANPQCRDLAVGNDLTNTGVEFSWADGNRTLIPYAVFDGGDDLAHADAGDFDVTGSETLFEASARGLTIGCWVYPTSLGATQAIIGKWDVGGGANQRSYLLELLNTNVFQFSLSVDGTAVISATSTVTVSANTWYCVQGAYNTGVRQEIYVNRGRDSVAPTVASIFGSTAEFNVGAQDNGAGNRFTGRVSMAFLCASGHQQIYEEALYEQTRGLYDV